MFNLYALPAPAQRAYIDKLVATGLLTVTRCPAGAKEGDTCIRRKGGGGMLPAHLDPRELGDTLEQVEQAERERIAEPHNAALSRAQRVHATSRKIRKAVQS
mgnify:CR=1 FL=1